MNKMNILDMAGLSMEMIDFQPNQTFFKELTILFEDVLGNNRSEIFEKNFTEKLQAVIKHHTKLKNVAVFIGSPLSEKDDFSAPVNISNIPGTIKIRNLKLGFNYKTGHFTGDTKELTVYLLLPIKWIINKSLTAEEFAAVVLHEIGHIAFDVDFSVRQVNTNLALELIAKELKKGAPAKERINVYRRALDEAQIKNINPSELEQIDDIRQISVIFSNSILNDYRSELGSQEYDKTIKEYYCDMYAVRQGAGKALVTALQKVSRLLPNYDFRMAARISLGVSAALSGVVLAASSTIVLPTLVMGAAALQVLSLLGVIVTTAPTESEYNYDDLYTRVKRIRQQTSQVLQDKKLSKREVDDIVQSLKKIDELLATLDKSDSVFNDFAVRLFSKGARRRLSSQQIQNEYEDFASNKLFEKSAILRTLN